MLDFKNVRLSWNLPPYPPYHTGQYMEEYFYTAYIRNKVEFDKTGFTLLPIFWTTAYLNQANLKPYINALPKNLKYFCVSQHDDAIKERLPDNTIVFSAGGNSGGIPIPLVCSPIPNSFIKTPKNQNIFCSFVGSNTHPVRQKMVEVLNHDPLFVLQTDTWSWNINQNKQELFFNATSNSKFTLCPRGYGAQSFRFYEALQLGSVPVYIHDDKKWMPYSKQIDWNEFSIAVSIEDISKLKDILLSISEQQRLKMVTKGLEVYKNVFALENLPNKILQILHENN